MIIGIDNAPQPLWCPTSAEGVNRACGHRMLPLQGHLAANVAAVEGQTVRMDGPLDRPLPGAVNGAFRQAQEQVHEEVAIPTLPSPHQVSVDQERGTEVQTKH